jgi:hypothetical protein
MPLLKSSDKELAEKLPATQNCICTSDNVYYVSLFIAESCIAATLSFFSD